MLMLFKLLPFVLLRDKHKPMQLEFHFLLKGKESVTTEQAEV